MVGPCHSILLFLIIPLLLLKEYVATENIPQLEINGNEHATRIQGPRMEVVQQMDTTKVLHCIATSKMAPNITWEIPGEVKPDSISTNSISDTTTVSRLQFTLDEAGTFDSIIISCRAFELKPMANDVVKTFVLLPYRGTGSNLSYTWLMLAIGALFLTLLVLLIVSVFCGIYYRKLQDMSRLQLENQVEEFMTGTSVPMYLGAEYGKSVAKSQPYDKGMYELNPKHLIVNEQDLLGVGVFGKVWKGKLEDENGKILEVAVKTTNQDAPLRSLQQLLTELKVLMYIGHHEHIVEFLGAVTSTLHQGRAEIVMHYYAKGCLLNYLRNPVHRNSAHPHTEILINSIRQWALEICKGMAFLAEKKIVHGDLAARNILLDDNFVIKISDFGLSHQMYDYGESRDAHMNAQLPWRWLPSESLSYFQFSEKSDVWAYGITLWEMFSLGGVPYPEINFNSEYIKSLEFGRRLERPELATAQDYEVMLKTWALHPADRPRFSELLNIFQNENQNCPPVAFHKSNPEYVMGMTKELRKFPE